MDSVRDRVGNVPDSKEKTDALNGIAERYTTWWNQKQSLIDSLPGKALASASSHDLIRIGDLAESLHSDIDRRVKSVLDRHKSEMQERAKTMAAEVKARSPQKDHSQDRER
jgi:gas vesicle protein